MDTLTRPAPTVRRYAVDDLARLAYHAWAANKNVPDWESLPDFRKHTWRVVARTLFTRIAPLSARLD